MLVTGHPKRFAISLTFTWSFEGQVNLVWHEFYSLSKIYNKSYISSSKKKFILGVWSSHVPTIGSILLINSRKGCKYIRAPEYTGTTNPDQVFALYYMVSCFPILLFSIINGYTKQRVGCFDDYTAISLTLFSSGWAGLGSVIPWYNIRTYVTNWNPAVVEFLKPLVAWHTGSFGLNLSICTKKYYNFLHHAH